MAQKVNSDNKYGEFTQDQFNAIFEEIVESNFGIVKILKNHNLKVCSFFKYIDADEGLSKQYARVKQLQAERLISEIIEIADDSSQDEMKDEKGKRIENREFVNRSRLRVDTRKWAASKLIAKTYGDKIELTPDSAAKLAGFNIKFTKSDGND